MYFNPIMQLEEHLNVNPPNLSSLSFKLWVFFTGKVYWPNTCSIKKYDVYFGPWLSSVTKVSYKHVTINLYSQNLNKEKALLWNLLCTSKTNTTNKCVSNNHYTCTQYKSFIVPIQQTLCLIGYLNIPSEFIYHHGQEQKSNILT